MSLDEFVELGHRYVLDILRGLEDYQPSGIAKYRSDNLEAKQVAKEIEIRETATAELIDRHREEYEGLLLFFNEDEG